MINVEVTKSDLGITAKEWRATMREIFMVGARYWQQNILPRHFKSDAYAKYNYDIRDDIYEMRKRKKMGHNLPLVYTGTMRDMLLGAADVSAVGDKTAVVKLHGPRYLPLRRFRLNEPDKARELTVILNAEEKEIAAVMDEAMTEKTGASGIGTRKNAQVAAMRGQVHWRNYYRNQIRGKS